MMYACPFGVLRAAAMALLGLGTLQSHPRVPHGIRAAGDRAQRQARQSGQPLCLVHIPEGHVA